MKKFLVLASLIYLTKINAINFTVPKDSLSIENMKGKITVLEQKALAAIQNENYNSLEELLKSGKINSRIKVNGKPLIIHAAIHDKAEMILLLAKYGAMMVEPTCDEGKDIMEYAIENNSIHAQAQIIVIRA